MNILEYSRAQFVVYFFLLLLSLIQSKYVAVIIFKLLQLKLLACIENVYLFCKQQQQQKRHLDFSDIETKQRDIKNEQTNE